MSDPTAGPRPAPASPAVDDPKKEVVYRSLSLLAVVGLGLAGAYAAVVVLGGLLAFYHGDPWLMPGWSALFPIAAAALSVLGLMQIQRSEGTLAGEKAARWGLLLSLLVGLGYWAYVGATFYAITHGDQGADQFGRQYLTKLAARDPFGAFRLTLPAADRPPDDDKDKLRAQLERRFNNFDTPNSLKSPLSTYWQSEPVRMLGLGGPETTFESLGVEKWDYVGGGYEVHLLYRVAMPEMTYVLELTVFGKEGKRGEGRQWEVKWNETGMRGDPQMSAAGKNRLGAAMGSRMLLMKDFLMPITEGRLAQAVVATRPRAERDAAENTAAAGQAALLLADGLRSGAAFGANPGAACLTVARHVSPEWAPYAAPPQLKGFLDGDLVRTDDYWAPDDIREKTIQMVRDHFRHPDGVLAATLMPDMGARGLPYMQAEGDHVVVGHDLGIYVPRGRPLYYVESRLMLECDQAEVEAGTLKTVRVRSLELISGKTLPSGAPGPMPQRPRPGM